MLREVYKSVTLSCRISTVWWMTIVRMKKICTAKGLVRRERNMKLTGSIFGLAIISLSSTALGADYLHVNGHNQHWASDILALLQKDKPTPPGGVTIAMTPDFDIHVYVVPGTFTGIYTIQRMRHAPDRANAAIKAIMDGGSGKIIGFERLLHQNQQKEPQQQEWVQEPQAPQESQQAQQPGQAQQPQEPQQAQQEAHELPLREPQQQGQTQAPQEPQQQGQSQQPQEPQQAQQQGQSQQPQEPQQAQQQEQVPSPAPTQADAQPSSSPSGEQTTVYVLTWTKPAS
jgi:flagellar biosynthesis GTPase FlhF